jgi:DNA-directed RNA polymerase subunit RPC12/RpoP
MGEAWRLFGAGSGRHVVFPPERQDFAVSRRKKAVAGAEYEVWLRLIEAPKTGAIMEAPPPIVISNDGARYRCGRCGSVLLIAELGSLKDFVVRCRRCNRCNEVPL